jgi:NADPH-dependent 2,4-dienoyl-CoA reductase/sulfur reductase-like enzyme
MVDEYLRTSAEDVFAAGDVAQVYDPFTGRTILDSLWGPAREQGRRAGLNMTGESAPYLKTMAFNVTRLAGLTTTIIGAVGGREVDEDIAGIVRGDSEAWRQIPDAIAAQSDFDVNRIRLMIGENTLEGAVIMGDQTLSQPVHHIISHRMDITPIRDALLEAGAPISDILTDFWVKKRAESGSL